MTGLVKQIVEDPPCQPKEQGSVSLGQGVPRGHWRPLNPHPGAIRGGGHGN